MSADKAVLDLYMQMAKQGLTISDYLDVAALSPEKTCLAIYRFARVFAMGKKYVIAQRLLASLRGGPKVSDQFQDCVQRLKADLRVLLEREAESFADNVWQ